MFTPLDAESIKKIKDSGYLTIAAAYPYKGRSIDGISNVPHYVMFTSKDKSTEPTNIFNCSLSTIGKTFVLDNVVLNRKARLLLEESEVHMFVGWLLEDLPMWVLGYGKDLTVVTTNIPHCTEWMIEYGYHIKTKDLFDKAGGFRGTGRATEICCKNNLPF